MERCAAHGMGISAAGALSIGETRFRASRIWGGTHLACWAMAACHRELLFPRTLRQATTMRTRGRVRSPVRDRYGDFFGDSDGEVFGVAAAVAPAADGTGVAAAASGGFTLSSSTSKRSVAFGPMSPPAPPGP